MTVWRVLQGGQAVYFRYGVCASSFYNADRDNRTAPEDIEPPDGITVLDCHEVRP
jgi:hypothetical protein